MTRNSYEEIEEYSRYLSMKKLVEKGYTIKQHRQWEGKPFFIIGKSLDDYILIYDERSLINAMRFLLEGKQLSDFANIGNDKVYCSIPDDIFELNKKYFE